MTLPPCALKRGVTYRVVLNACPEPVVMTARFLRTKNIGRGLPLQIKLLAKIIGGTRVNNSAAEWWSMNEILRIEEA